MKLKRTFVIIVFTLLAVLATGCAPSKVGDGIVVGSSYRLAQGETLDQDLAVFGGSVMLEEGSKINGSLSVFGGTVVVDGTVDGDLAAFGGVVSLEDHAVIEGDVLTYGASVSTNEKAVVKGTIGSGRPPTRLPGSASPVASAFDSWIGLVTGVFWRLFQSLAMAALAVLVALFALRPMERVGNAIAAKPVAARTMGALTLVAGGGILVAIVITIILIPFTIIGLLLMGLATLFGWMVLGLITGERIAHLFNQEWSGPVCAGLGTLVISLAGNLIGIIPCVGWLVVAAAMFIGLGGVVLTRFGLQVYPVLAPEPPAAPPGGVEVA
jgi:cytoskeletal protein CcmA (bactofilin family)